eukprot:Sspe_Gene.51248::Locus_28465_Transcript_1_1_Confidence_1.000_Length_1171::g.51248::m.51248/K16365/SGTA; small glutamine-rich tetratricopeptide repeat-containing protein alpha
MAEVVITETQKRIVVSILQFLKTSQALDASQLEVAESMLTDGFKLSKGDLETLQTAAPLEEIWERGAPKEPMAFDEAKFQEFLSVLKTKGYFQGCDEGSDEYNSRLEKARAKFRAKSNPYEGLNAEQLKEKGNQLMTKSQFKEAVGFYTKAIELEPDNAIFYSNRAAAYTRLSQYKDCIRDCTKAVQLKPDYVKAYSRLATGHFHDRNYPAAVDAIKKALELEPENETYKSDLAVFEAKAAQSPAMPGGFPGGLGDMFNNPAFMNMANNPAFLDMANNLMSDPQFRQMSQMMAEKMGFIDGEGNQNFDRLQEVLQNGEDMVQQGEDGNMIRTPFGLIDKAELEKMKEREDLKDNPK